MNDLKRQQSIPSNWYDEDYYASSPASDPEAPPLPTRGLPWELNRVRRSGSWREDA